ncbi:MAG: ribokinase [Beijerinckiaceae bacterium]
MTLARVLVVGSVNMDVSVHVQHLPCAGETVPGSDATVALGGKGANQAVAAARLGGHVHLVGCVGNDAFGQQAKDALAFENLDLSTLRSIDSVSTGVALITVAKNGQNMITLSPGANARLASSDIDKVSGLFNKAAILLLQNEIPADVSLHAARLMRARGGLVIVDPAPATGCDKALVGLADLVTPNETEATQLSGIVIRNGADALASARWFVAHGAANAIVKWGANGVVYAGQWGEGHSPAPQVHAVDTVAAGDCFNGALAVGLGEKMPFVDAIAFACRAAAVSVMRPGASVSMPHRDEL